jgi:hypothetical protein
MAQATTGYAWTSGEVVTPAKLNQMVNSATVNNIQAADIAGITATGSTTARTLPDRFADTINVKDFGAVGNGVADDTAAWASFVSATGTKAATGTFLVSGALKSYSNGFLRTGSAAVSDTAWNVDVEPTFARSTPATAIVSLGGHYDALGSAGRNYKWGIQSWMTNPGTMPMTNIDAVSQGWLARGAGFAARQIGAGGDGHAVEVLSGQWAAQARVSTTSGSAVVIVDSIVLRGSRFSVGDPISGTNIPTGATIVSVTKGAKTATGKEVQSVSVVSGGSGYVVGDVVTLLAGSNTFPAQARVLTVSGSAIASLLVIDGGNYTADPVGTVFLGGGSGAGATVTASMIVAGFGNPTAITISSAATGTGTGITVTALSTEDTMNVGVLVSGSGTGGTDGTGNKNGRGIQLQSYGNAAFFYGINFATAALRSDGTGIRFASGTASRGISFESFSLDQAIRVSGGSFTNILLAQNTTCSGSIVSLSGVTATNGINFAVSNTFSGAAITLDGQSIATTTTNGMRIGTNALQKIGFWNAAPVARPAAIANATDAATTQARLNDLLGAMRTIGLITT